MHLARETGIKIGFFYKKENAPDSRAKRQNKRRAKMREETHRSQELSVSN